MSISSWERMWQCHTYSQPKFTLWFRISVIATPFGSNHPAGGGGISVAPSRQRRVDQAHAVGHLERDLRRSRNGRPHREVGDLQRVHPEGVFPAQLDGVYSWSYHCPSGQRG